MTKGNFKPVLNLKYNLKNNSTNSVIPPSINTLKRMIGLYRNKGIFHPTNVNKLSNHQIKMNPNF